MHHDVALHRCVRAPFGRGSRYWASAVALGLAFLSACGSAGGGTLPSDPGSGGGTGSGGGSGGTGGGSGGGSGAGNVGGGVGPSSIPADLTVPATAKFVAPSGSDQNLGSAAQPWRTLAYATSRLAAGDTLLVRGGTYLERNVRIATTGTQSQPVVIRSYPNETVSIDGGYTQFRAAGNSDWVLHDSSRSIWRSSASFAGAGQVFGYFGSTDGDWRLVPYASYAHLAADVEDYRGSSSYYCGPGVFWNQSDQRIYVRTQRSREQARFSMQVPHDLDARNTPMFLFPSDPVLDVASTARWVRIEGMALRHGERIADLPNGSQRLTFRNCSFRFGQYGFVVRGGFHDLLCEGSTFDAAFPRWMPRSDVKADNPMAATMQDAAFEFQGAVSGVEIGHCRFLGLFDGIDTYGTPSEFRVHHNEFFGIRDDAFEIATAGHHVRFDHNLVRQTTQGVSWNGSTAPSLANAGTKWIDHNVIDTSEEQFYGRPDPLQQSYAYWQGPDNDGMAAGPAFSLHDTGALNAPDPWKVYRNTFMGGVDVDGEGLGIAYAFQGSNATCPHEVFDNVFVLRGDQWALRRARVGDGSQTFDGNLYWRIGAQASTPLFADFVGTQTRDFASLYDYMTSTLWSQSRAHYAPGWEAAGVEADPRLDANYRPAADGPAATGAVDLSTKGWPDAGAESHRGAIAP